MQYPLGTGAGESNGRNSSRLIHKSTSSAINYDNSIKANCRRIFWR